MVSFSKSCAGQKPASKRRQFRPVEKPCVYETYRTLKDGQKETIWIVDGRHHDDKRYRLTCHSEIEAKQKAEAEQALALGSFRLGTSLPMHVMVEAAEAHQQGISVREAVEFYKKTALNPNP